MRWTYNACVESILAGRNGYQLAPLRQFVNNDAVLVHARPWLTEVPFDVRYEAVRDLLKARAAYQAKQAVNKTGFELKFRSRRDLTQESIVVHKKHWGTHGRGLYASVFSSAVMKSSGQDPLPKLLPADSRLIRDRLNRWYLCVPTPLPDRTRSAPAHKVEAIDTGVRTFLTCYSPTAGLTEVGVQDYRRLERLDHHLDQLRSRMDTATARARKSMRRAALRMEGRIRNLVDDIHKKAALHLLTTYQEILLPAFSSSAMIKKPVASGKYRKLGKSTVRAMLHWAHYRFRQRLVEASARFPGSKVTLVTEEFTSRTCGVCGTVADKYSDKQFHCLNCGLKCDRDLLGARNILIKRLSELQQQAAGDTTVASFWDLTPGPEPCVPSDTAESCKIEYREKSSQTSI